MALPLTGHRRPWHDVDRPLSDAAPIAFLDLDGNYEQISASPCDRDRRVQLRRRLSPRCDKEHRVINPGSSLSALKEFLDSIALPASATAAASPSPEQAVSYDTSVISPQSRRCLYSTILVRRLPDWGLTFYIRVDREGDFHTYPHLGGPFQSLQEANIAIDCHLDDCKDTMFKKQEGVSLVEMAIRSSLYWLDGTRKKCSESQMAERNRDRIRLLVQALVDKYNEDHNLLGDLAYELKDVLHYQFISEGHRTIPKRSKYYHLNFTMKTKGADHFDYGTDDLFFVEIELMQGEHEELVVSRFCIITPNDNGHCYGCTNNGSADMKHPNNSYAYAGGHLNTYLPFEWSDSENIVDEEIRIRRIYEEYCVHVNWT
ncbi:uncharacterized protein [Lolium perenne]|uniref:uncharacterized protein isoform X3 n=1 Tax=Lolium perenne TaxID=4522 RepID=UPI0021F594BD|nr:uncharacterized protein LOC127318451 isoform X3 [Lolium perenne]XP_051204895.1 uncharacterized protein LOC127318451 isoform X3 [Lolium perenne]